MKKLLITVLTSLMFFSTGISAASAASYHVSHSATLSWKASYDISTKGNKITKVSNIRVHALTGRISNKRLIRNSSNKVTLKMTKTVGSIKYPVHLSATMKNNKLIVSSN